MQTALTILAAVLGLAAVAVFLMVRSHRNWVARQTPAGAWHSEVEGGLVTLTLEGGPAEGAYTRVAETGGVGTRESGRWQYAAGRLQIRVTAADPESQPGPGADSHYTVRFLGPDQIGIEGPHWPRLEYKRVPPVA